MWFSSTSLVVGAVSTIWNSVRHLDLPPEVKDAAWVWHKFACPNCGTSIRQIAASDKCDSCQTNYCVVSCIHCKSVNVYRTKAPVDEQVVNCRCCGKATDAPTGGRNSGVLILGRLLAEVAGRVHRPSAPVPIDHWLAAFTSEFDIADNTVAWLWAQFERRIKDQQTKLLDISVKREQHRAVAIALHMAVALTGSVQRASIEKLICSYGFDPLEFYDDEAGHSTAQFAAACKALELDQAPTLQQAERAYRKQARLYHPDLVHNRSDKEKLEAAGRMKAINLAFEVVCDGLAAGSVRLEESPWRNDDLASAVRRRRDRSDDQPREPSPPQGDRAEPPSPQETSKVSKDESVVAGRVVDEKDSTWTATAALLAAVVFIPLFPVLAVSMLGQTKVVPTSVASEDADIDSIGSKSGSLPEIAYIEKSNFEKSMLRDQSPRLSNIAEELREIDTKFSIDEGKPKEEINSEVATEEAVDIQQRHTSKAIEPKPSVIVEAWKSSDFKQVVSLCEVQLNETPDAVQLIYLRGWAQAKLGEHSAAYVDYQKALLSKLPVAMACNPDYAKTVIHFARIAMDDVKRKVDNGEAYKVDVLQADELYRWLETAIRLDPRNAEPYALRSLLSETQNYPDSADKDWQVALQLGYKTPRSSSLLLPAVLRRRQWFDVAMENAVTASFIETDDVGVLLEDDRGRRKRANVLTLSPLDQVWLLEMPEQLEPFGN